MPAIETRMLSGPVQIEDGRLIGHAAVFGSRSADLGGFVEVVQPQAFRRSLETGRDIVATIDHDTSRLLGRTSAGTVAVTVDNHGLRYDIQLPDTQYARDLAALVKRGDIRGSSFAFRVGQEGQRWVNDSGVAVRELLDVDLVDVSVVVNPAYPAANDVALRSLDEWQQADGLVAVRARNAARIRLLSLAG